MRKQELVSQVIETLKEADFNISRVVPYGSYCFDIAASRKLVLMLKILINVDSMYPAQAEQLKRLCHLISAYPLIIGDRTRTEKIEDDVVHERYDLPALNIDTLRMLVENSSMPLIFGTKGGYYVQIDGEALRRERKRKGLSLRQVAERIGVSRESVYSYEHGGNATVDTAMALVDELGVDLVRPVQVLKRVNMDLEPDRAVDNDLLNLVLSQLTRLGFGVYTTPRTPFDAVARESDSQLLAAVFDQYSSLRRHVNLISKLSHTVDIASFMVSNDERCEKSLKGVPILCKEELDEMDGKRDLSGIIKEKKET